VTSAPPASRYANKLIDRLQAILGFSQAQGRDADVEQAFIRVLVTAMVLVYGTWAGIANGAFPLELQIALTCGCVTGSAGLWMLYRFHIDPARPAFMRSFGIAADIIPITAGLFLAEEIGVPLVGLYLWITVGNGFRFGPRYLLQSYLLSGLCFALLLAFSPFWQQHRLIGIGLAILLGAIPLYVLVLLSRITAQRKAVEQLSEAKSRFVANVSHELRTPLTGVVAVHDLLMRRPISASDRDLIDRLGSAIQSLTLSVDAILQMSKLEAGAESVDWDYLNLRMYLQRFDQRTATSAEAKGLGWSVSISDSVPGLLVCDRSHLDHVLGNLINNAIKFTPSGEVRLDVSLHHGNVRFEVKDTGIGIPASKQAHIFDRFVQADTSATRKFGGTGLGTSIAHDLVELMGGSIGLISSEGVGSTFWIELPACGQPINTLIPISLETIGTVHLVSETLGEASAIRAFLHERGLDSSLRLPSDLPDLVAGSRPTAPLVLIMPADNAIEVAEKYLKGPTSCRWILAATTDVPIDDVARIWKVGAADWFPVSEGVGRVYQAIRGLIHFLDAPVPVRQELALARRVLVADDNESNLLLLARILEEAGHAVRAVTSGDVAYDLMMTGQFDIALLDNNMPEMTGPNAVKLFRAGEVGAVERLPILIVSADATADARNESMRAGADGHIVKPVRAAELLSTIFRLTQGRPIRVERRATKRDYPKLVSSSGRLTESPKTAPVEIVDRVLLDSGRFEELRRIANNDIGFMRRYSTASFADIESALTELRSSVNCGETQAAREALHKIDGTAANLGASAIAQAGTRMKAHVSDLRSPDASKALAEIATVCALTKSAMMATLEHFSTKTDTG
jgi:two-component system sensor histidine kinase RpfC